MATRLVSKLVDGKPAGMIREEFTPPDLTAANDAAIAVQKASRQRVTSGEILDTFEDSELLAVEVSSVPAVLVAKARLFGMGTRSKPKSDAQLQSGLAALVAKGLAPQKLKDLLAL